MFDLYDLLRKGFILYGSMNPFLTSMEEQILLTCLVMKYGLTKPRTIKMWRDTWKKTC